MAARARTAVVADPSREERARLCAMLESLGFGRVLEAEDGLAALIEELWFNGPRAEPSGHELGSPWGQMEAAEEKQ